MIPKIIHQIWIGPKPAPTKFMDTWKEENPDFENDSTTSEESDYDEIDVNDYLSDDDTPDYKLKTNNIFPDSTFSNPGVVELNH